jgi:AcrR family transcriptional regulator
MSANTRREQKAATRAAVKAAARGCFAETGYSGTNIADIARAAGVAHGTFYVHFPNKDAVLDELLEEFNDAFVGRLAPVFASAATAPVEQTVRATAEAFLDHWDGNRDFVEAYAERSASGLALTNLRDGVNPPMARLIGAALRRAAAHRDAISGNWDLVTHALLAMWLRIGMQYLFNDDVTREQATTSLVAMSVGSIEAILPAPREEER